VVKACRVPRTGFITGRYKNDYMASYDLEFEGDERQRRKRLCSFMDDLAHQSSGGDIGKIPQEDDRSEGLGEEEGLEAAITVLETGGNERV